MSWIANPNQAEAFSFKFDRSACTAVQTGRGFRFRATAARQIVSEGKIRRDFSNDWKKDGCRLSLPATDFVHRILRPIFHLNGSPNVPVKNHPCDSQGVNFLSINPDFNNSSNGPCKN